MQTVSTAACFWIIDREIEVIATKEPLERKPRFIVPTLAPGDIDSKRHSAEPLYATRAASDA